MADVGSYRCAFSATASAVICRSGATSRIHRLRPCVAATTSPAVGWKANSWTATVGRLLLILVHDRPRLIDAKAANSVPHRSRFGLEMSSRRHRVEPNAGRLATMLFQVWP